MREVQKAIEERQGQDEKRKSKFLGKARRARYNSFHKEEDEEKVKSLRERIHHARQSFHVSHSPC